MDKNRLIELKEEIEKAKEQVQELTGQKKQLLKRLKTEFGFDTIEQAEKEQAAMLKELHTLENQISLDYTNILTRYEGQG